VSAAGQTKQRPAQELPGRAFDLPVHPRSGDREQHDGETVRSTRIGACWKRRGV
jgi:hypothetical protein